MRSKETFTANVHDPNDRGDMNYLAKARCLYKRVRGRPHVMTSAMEFGKHSDVLDCTGKSADVKVGGVAVVVQDILTLFPKHLAECGGGRLSAVFPLYDGISTQGMTKGPTFSICVGKGMEQVRTHRLTLTGGAELHFVQHPWLQRRTIFRDTGFDLYHERGADPYPKGQYGVPPYACSWSEARSFALFNKAAAELCHWGDSVDVYHGHDYHASTAPFYFTDPDNSVQIVQIHNGGYQGIFKTPNFGDYRVASTQFPPDVPAGDYQRNDEFLGIWGIDFSTYMRFFEHDGLFNTYKGVLKFVGEHNLLSGMPVSPGYAAELGWTKNDVLSRVRAEKGGADPCHPDKLFVPNHGIDFRVVDGVYNGAAPTMHASVNRDLKKVQATEVAEKLKMIQHPIVREALQERDFNFGDRAALATAAGRQAALDTKRQLKELLQLEAFGKADPNKFLVVPVGRLVDQKNYGPFIANIDHLVERGAQVIVSAAAPKNDPTGQRDAAALKAAAERHGGEVKVYEYAEGRLLQLLHAGADLDPMPSKFEPCGIVDLEAASFGTVPGVHLVGGLDKVSMAFRYTWTDNTDHRGEVAALRRMLDEAHDEFRANRDKFDERRINGLKQEFPWKASFDQYLRNYRTAAAYRYLTASQAEVDSKRLNASLAYHNLRFALERDVDPVDLSHLRTLLERKPGARRRALEEQILTWLPPNEVCPKPRPDSGRMKTGIRPSEEHVSLSQAELHALPRRAITALAARVAQYATELFHRDPFRLGHTGELMGAIQLLQDFSCGGDAPLKRAPELEDLLRAITAECRQQADKEVAYTAHVALYGAGYAAEAVRAAVATIREPSQLLDACNMVVRSIEECDPDSMVEPRAAVSTFRSFTRRDFETLRAAAKSSEREHEALYPPMFFGEEVPHVPVKPGPQPNSFALY